MIPGEKIIELILEIILEAMKGQTPEQKKIMWDRHIENMKFWCDVFKIGQN